MEMGRELGEAGRGWARLGEPACPGDQRRRSDPEYALGRGAGLQRGYAPAQREPVDGGVEGGEAGPVSQEREQTQVNCQARGQAPV